MRIVFMGTPSFAAAILEELVSQHEVVAVYTRPDAVRGRGRSLVASPVKELAVSEGIPVHTPKTLRDADEQAKLSAYEPDAICVAAYGMILPREVLDLPKYGCINVHASLLPRWRGAAPVERAILAGDRQAGVCIMRMEEGLDTGDYCVCRSTDIGDKCAEDLTDELANLGARALLTALERIAAGCNDWVKQGEDEVTYAGKIEKGELDLDPSCSAAVNGLRVQASSEPHPSRCAIAGKRVTVLKAQVVPEDDAVFGLLQSFEAGFAQFVAKRLLLACESGVLEVVELKPDGKKAMDAKAFAAGLQVLKNGERWERGNV